MNRALVVSPHRDDAAFSCAITIKKLRAHFDVVVANCFTVSEYAPFRKSGHETITAIRRLEDVTFAASTGVLLRDLELVDAPQRLSIEFSEISYPRALNNGDAAVMNQIAEHVKSLNADLILLPLALGDHIDHRITQAAIMSNQFACLAFYEDLPYAAHLPNGMPEERAHQLDRNLTPCIVRQERGDEWKRSCAALYSSQINSETVEEISDYSLRYQKGERLWATPQALVVLNALAE